MEYSFKRGFKPDIERIHSVLAEEFPTEIAEADGKLQLSYGALKSISIWIDGKKLNVTTESDSGASDQVVLDTNKRFRDFLEKATGYTAKKRLQMAKKRGDQGRRLTAVKTRSAFPPQTAPPDRLHFPDASPGWN